jgi:hypothetical protein
MANRLLNLSLFLEEMGRDWRHNAKVSDAPDSAAPNRE